MPQLDALFDEMLRNNASDLHLSVGYPPMLRVKGELVPHGSEVISLPRMHDLLDELLDARKRKIFRENNDLGLCLRL